MSADQFPGGPLSSSGFASVDDECTARDSNLRQEKVRQALEKLRRQNTIQTYDTAMAEYKEALAEVEEWEKDVAATNDVLAQAAREVEAAEAERDEWKLCAENEAKGQNHWCERGRAAEAERDRLAEALRRISLLDGANAPQGVPTAEYLRGIARAALAADEVRVCMVCGKGPVTVSVCDRCCE